MSSGIADGRRFINHGGASVGFLSQNTVYPDDRAAIVVLTNGEYSGATSTLTNGLAEIILPPVARPGADRAPARPHGRRARALRKPARRAVLDRALLTTNNRGYFTPVALADYRVEPAPARDARPASSRSARRGCAAGSSTATIASSRAAGPCA